MSFAAGEFTVPLPFMACFLPFPSQASTTLIQRPNRRNQESIAHLAVSNKRVVRQTLFLTSNYYHNLMLVHASESAEVPLNIKATLEAAHEAITAFFTFFALLPEESRVWWVLNHRAFLEALCIGGILKEARRAGGLQQPQQPQSQQQRNGSVAGDWGGGGGEADFKYGSAAGARRKSSVTIGRKWSASTSGGDGDGDGDVEQMLVREPLYTRARADISKFRRPCPVSSSSSSIFLSFFQPSSGEYFFTSLPFFPPLPKHYMADWDETCSTHDGDYGDHGFWRARLRSSQDESHCAQRVAVGKWVSTFVNALLSP